MFHFIRLLITAHSGISSKRLCGVLGFITIVGILIYCTIESLQAPNMIDPFMCIVCCLLGIDSITGIWKTKA